MKMRHLLIAGAAALALGLAGCGGNGGGDDSSVMPPEPPAPPMPPAPPPVASVMIPDAMYLDAANMPMAGMMTIEAGESYTNNGVVFSCPADGDACEVEVMDDGSVTSTGGEATAMLTADARMQVDEDMETARVTRRDRAIGVDRGLEAAMNLPDATATGVVGEDDITINRAPGAMASVRSTGYSVAGTMDNGGWHGTHLTDPVPGAVRHLYVFTDIEPPTRIQFYNWDGDSTTPSRYEDSVTEALTAPATEETTITPLGLGGAGETFSASTADPIQFPRPQSPEEGSLRQVYRNNEDTDGTATTFEQFSTSGNYNGAGGRYVCTGGTADAPCSVTVAPDGSYTVVGTWTFVPELNSTAWLQDGGTARSGNPFADAQVGDFMHFGWWMQVPTAQTGAYTFRYYAEGTPYQLAAGDLSRGSATYNGRAAGAYVIQEIDDTGVVDGQEGMFTANASLTATFSGTAAGGMLEGTISGFQDGNGMDMPGWSVTLNEQTITGAVTSPVTSAGINTDPDSAGFDGTTATLGDQTLHGRWAAQFFGQPRTADAYPLGVGGTFQADNESASIAGAFGARR